MEVTMDLPTPPLPLMTPITFFTLLCSLSFAEKSSGCRLSEQLCEQLEQSLLQFSAIACISCFIGYLYYFADSSVSSADSSFSLFSWGWAGSSASSSVESASPLCASSSLSKAMSSVL